MLRDAGCFEIAGNLSGSVKITVASLQAARWPGRLEPSLGQELRIALSVIFDPDFRRACGPPWWTWTAVSDEAVTRYFRPLTHTRELGLAI